MILQRSPGENWFAAAMRYGALEGVSREAVFTRMGQLVSIEGFSERRAAYLTLAEMGVVEGVE